MRSKIPKAQYVDSAQMQIGEAVQYSQIYGFGQDNMTRRGHASRAIYAPAPGSRGHRWGHRSLPPIFDA